MAMLRMHRGGRGGAQRGIGHGALFHVPLRVSLCLGGEQYGGRRNRRRMAANSVPMYTCRAAPRGEFHGARRLPARCLNSTRPQISRKAAARDGHRWVVGFRSAKATGFCGAKADEVRSVRYVAQQPAIFVPSAPRPGFLAAQHTSFRGFAAVDVIGHPPAMFEIVFVMAIDEQIAPLVE